MNLGLVYSWVNKEWLCFRQRLFCWQEGGHSQVQQLFWGGTGSSCYRRQHWEKNLWNVQILNQQLYLLYIQLDRITHLSMGLNYILPHKHYFALLGGRGHWCHSHGPTATIFRKVTLMHSSSQSDSYLDILLFTIYLMYLSSLLYISK